MATSQGKTKTPSPLPVKALAKTPFMVVHEVATPHSNVIMAALNRRNDIDLEMWYFETQASKYGFTNDLTHKVKPSSLYPSNHICWELVGRIVDARNSTRLFLLGWSNPTTRLVFVLMCLLRRPFGMWFDLPQENLQRSLPKRLLRELFYLLLRFGRAHVFSVGQVTVDYFRNRGIPSSRITNLPILVETDAPRESFTGKAENIRKAYGLKKDDILFSAGSRLIHDKGFDIVIDAIAGLPETLKKRTHCVIVGQGEELENLKAQAKKAGLEKQIHFPGWMEFPDYQALIATSIAYIHPARFDAWGATIFAHAIGVPVIGSVGAGSAKERIKHGINGWQFNPDHPRELTKWMQEAIEATPARMKKMSKEAMATARQWSPESGADILVKGIPPLC